MKQILKSIQQLNTLGKQLEFVWIRDHVGVFRNEHADKAAQTALKLPEISLNIPISKSAIRSLPTTTHPQPKAKTFTIKTKSHHSHLLFVSTPGKIPNSKFLKI